MFYRFIRVGFHVYLLGGYGPTTPKRRKWRVDAILDIRIRRSTISRIIHPDGPPDPHPLLKTIYFLARPEVVDATMPASKALIASRLLSTCYTPLSVTRFARAKVTPFKPEGKYDALRIKY